MLCMSKVRILFAFALLALPFKALAVPVPGEFVLLDKVNWDGSVHRAWNSPSKVGGWARGPSISYSYETLAKFDISSFSAVQSATLRFRVAGGNTGGPQTITAYAADLHPWNVGSVTYNTFCNSPYDCPAWGTSLGGVTANATQPGWYEIASPALLTKVQQWVGDPASNRGLVLSGNFYTHVYYATVDSVELVVNGTTSPPGGGTPPSPEPPTATSTCPDEHMLYAKGNVVVRDRAKVQGGSIRAEDSVEVSYDAQVKGDLLGKNAILKDRAIVNGNVTLSATLSRSSSAVVSGAVLQNASLPPCTLNEKPAIVFGSADKTILWDVKETLPPGSYRDLTLYARGAVKFLPGVYNFRKIWADAETKFFIQPGGDVEINVQESVFMHSRFQMILEGEGTLPRVRIYSNQTTTFQVGADSKLFGTLAVPNAEVQILWRTALQGNIQAKKVSIESDAVITNALDTDGDGVVDLVETIMGTDPSSAASKPALGMPSKWFVDPIQNNSVVYNYSAFQEYASRSTVSVTYPAGTLTSSMVPVVSVSPTLDASISVPSIPAGWGRSGQYFEVKGGVKPGEKVLFGFPLPSSASSMPQPSSLVIRHFEQNQWMYEPVESVTNGVAYAYVRSFSPFFVMQNASSNPVIYLNSGDKPSRGTGRNGTSWANAYTTLDSALADAVVSKKEIWMAGTPWERLYPHWGPSGTAWSLQDGVRIYGGFKGDEIQREQRDPKVNKCVITPGYARNVTLEVVVVEYPNYWRLFEHLSGGSVYIDGVTMGFEAGYLVPSDIEASALLQHHGTMTFKGCSFRDMRNAPAYSLSRGGAIHLTGHDAVLNLDSCLFLRCMSNRVGGAIAIEPKTTVIASNTIFQENRISISSAGNSTEATRVGGAIWNAGNLVVKNCIFQGNFAYDAASVLYATSVLGNASSSRFENSLFYVNGTSTTSVGATILADSGITDVTFLNCTFNQNHNYATTTGMIYARKNASIRLTNSILWGNTKRGPGSIEKVPGEIYSATYGKVILRNCDLKGGLSGAGVEGSPVEDDGSNLGSDTVLHDPKFLSTVSGIGPDGFYFTEDDGFQLGEANSGVFDQGIASVQPATDILGKLRAPRHSMGAYEFLHTAPVVAIVYPGRDTAITGRTLMVRYEINGEAFTRTDTLHEGENQVVVFKTEFGLKGADTLLVNVDTTPPAIAITDPGRDTAVTTTPIVVRYTVDGVLSSRTVNMATGVNEVVISESDSLGNKTTAIRKIYYSTSAIVPIVADAKARDTVFSYELFTLDARGSRGPDGASLTYNWRQVLGASVYVNTQSSRVAGVVSRGQNRLQFELTVADNFGFFQSAKDTVTIEVVEPTNVLDVVRALEVAKSNQDGAFALSIDPSEEGSRYTLENSIRLQGSLTGTTGALGTIRWTCNSRTGTFQPLSMNWESPVISLDPGDNWITLIYTQGSQIAVDRILVSRGEVDMTGFDLNPGVLWADSAMSFKLIVNVDDPAVSSVRLVRITGQEMDLGALVDDGTGGDDFAMDRRHTLQFNLTPKADSVYWFRVKANKSGVSSYSALYTFHPQQKYSPATFQNILNVHANASVLFNALKANRSEKAAMDSVANWLIEQPSVAVAGVGPGEKAICWQYSNGVHAMISNAPPGTRGSGKVKTKAFSPYQFDGAFGPFDDGLTAYRGAIVPAANADTALYDADSLLLNTAIPDSTVTIEHWKNWGGYKAVVVASHGNTFGYDSLAQIKWKPTTDTLAMGKSLWAKPYVTVVNHTKADTTSGSKYWKDLTSGGKTFPRIIVVDIGYGLEYAMTSKFFKTYNSNLKGSLLSFGSCRSLYNDELWNAIRANGDAATAMIGYSDYVKGNFAGKAAEIIFKSLVNGKTLRQSVDSVVGFCGQTGNSFCTVKNGKAWDSTKAGDQGAFLEYRGDSSYTLIPRKGRVWAWGSGGSGRGLYSCASVNADTVPNIRNLANVSGGAGHGLALEVNGTVWGWGWNGSAQLGLAPSGGGGGSNPPTVNYSSCTPVQVFPGTGYKAIAAGVGRSLAVDAAGKVWRAGEFTGTAPYQWTTNGTAWWMQGVIGVTPQRDTIPGLGSIAAVAAGNLHNLALHANGEVWAWGGNGAGELGMGDTLSRNTPVKIPGLTNIVAISTGQNPALGLYSSHSLALDQTGRVWAWGENEFGQLGVGDTLDRTTPQIISGLSRIRSISAGVGGSSAVDSTGRLWVWGWNDRGQLALGNANKQHVPVQVPVLSGVVSVSHGVFPVILDNAGNAKWSCGSACGNTFVSKKTGSLDVGAGGDEFGMSIAP